MSQQLADFLASNWFVFLFVWVVANFCEMGIVLGNKKNPDKIPSFERILAVIFGTICNIASGSLLISAFVIFFRWKGWA
jgi:hypothetical protein